MRSARSLQLATKGAKSDRTHEMTRAYESRTGLAGRQHLKQPTGGVEGFLHVSLLQGELSFERLLRVDGSFKGKLSSTGDLVIGANGVVRGNIVGLREVREMRRPRAKARRSSWSESPDYIFLWVSPFVY